MNDGISVADFPLCYSSVYDAMDSVMLLGHMAKLVHSTCAQSFPAITTSSVAGILLLQPSPTIQPLFRTVHL